jgi:hypothetical protein
MKNRGGSSMIAGNSTYRPYRCFLCTERKSCFPAFEEVMTRENKMGSEFTASFSLGRSRIENCQQLGKVLFNTGSRNK